MWCSDVLCAGMLNGVCSGMLWLGVWGGCLMHVAYDVSARSRPVTASLLVCGVPAIGLLHVQKTGDTMNARHGRVQYERQSLKSDCERSQRYLQEAELRMLKNGKYTEAKERIQRNIEEWKSEIRRNREEVRSLEEDIGIVKRKSRMQGQSRVSGSCISRTCSIVNVGRDRLNAG